METEKTDIYRRITNQIIEALERGAGKCRLPWHRTGADIFAPMNAQSKNFYRGINVLSLWAAAEKNGYNSGLWGTYRQWQELGAQVRKHEKAALIVLWKFSGIETDEDYEDETAGVKRSHRVLARGYCVFNEAQVEGYTPPKDAELTSSERVQRAEEFFSRLNADIRSGGDQAYYSPATDHIQMPQFEMFNDPAAYYSVLGHETTHWTGAPGRLNRDFGERFHSQAYAMEELVAELGAAFICADLGLGNEPRPDHAAYLASWITMLKNDKRAIFTAASKAQSAVDWMKCNQGNEAHQAA